MNSYQAQASALAEDVWDDAKDAEAFMHRPHPLLENQTPFTVAATQAGAKRVEGILHKIRWGLPT